MITRILTILLAGYILFELIEHVLFPLVWLIMSRNRKSPCGKEGMPGKMAEVKSWEGGKGRVLVEGELWSAASDDLLKPGDRAVVQEVDGLVLRIAASKGGTGLLG